MPAEDNYFTNELRQYYERQGKKLSDNVMVILSKTTSELSSEESEALRNIIIPTSAGIKKALIAQIEEDSIGENLWFDKLKIHSDTNIGRIANEVALEKWGRQLLEEAPGAPIGDQGTGDVPLYCRKCGTLIEREAIFCANCGSRVSYDADEQGNIMAIAATGIDSANVSSSVISQPSPPAYVSNPSYQQVCKLLSDYRQSRDQYLLHLGQTAYGMVMSGTLGIFGDQNPKEAVSNIYNQYAGGDYNIFLGYLGQMTYQQYLEDKIDDASILDTCRTLDTITEHIPYLEIGTYAFDPNLVEKVLSRPIGNTAIPQYVGGHPSLPDKKNSPYASAHLSNLITRDGFLSLASFNEMIFTIQLKDIMSIRSSTGLFYMFKSGDEGGDSRQQPSGYATSMIDQFILDSRGKRVLALEASDTRHGSIAALFSYGGSKITLDAYVAQDVEALNCEIAKRKSG